MRHHEDRVLRELGEALRLEAVDEHRGRLLHLGRMAEDAARRDEEIELHVVDDGLAARLLREDIADGALLLHALQRRRELLVLRVRKAQRLARDGLLEHQRLRRLRDRGRADHLVLDAVPQLALVHVDVHPAQHLVEPRLRAHVRDRVAHPEVRAHRAVEGAVEHAENIGGRAADVDAHGVEAVARGDALQDVADGARRRHDRRVAPRDQLVVAGRVRHHMLEEDIVDLVARGPEVLPLERRTQVVDDGEVEAAVLRVAEDRAHLRRCVLVSRVDHGKLVFAAEARPRLRGRDLLCDLHDLLHVAAVGAARDQHHVGPQLADPLDALVRLALVVRGDRVHHDRARAERRALGARGRHLRDHARDDHLQPAARARGRDVEIAAVGVVLILAADDRAVVGDEAAARELADLGQRVRDADRHIREGFLDRRRRLRAARLTPAVADALDEDRLRRRRAAVGGEDVAELR